LVEDNSQVQARFLEFFRTATNDNNSPRGHDPYPFQMRLATEKELPELIDIPTGLGKTDAVVLAWLWRRRFASQEIRARTPRRLVYCLPMRMLVEQTAQKAKMWPENLGLFSDKPGEEELADTSKCSLWTENADRDKTRIAVTVLMGGECKDDWDLYPERDAIIIGTQDMLLSRALNRGYSMSRYTLAGALRAAQQRLPLGDGRGAVDGRRCRDIGANSSVLQVFWNHKYCPVHLDERHRWRQAA
jgi:CRISPR-associated endonuclease/helicase Cas3